jgi:FixJ family two-component response regulator
VRTAIRSLLRSLGYRVEQFASAKEFLRFADIAGAGCVVLDVRMPGMTGLDLRQALLAVGRRLPTIFVTAHHDVAARRRAVGAGAFAYLQKPFAEEALVAAVRAALGDRMTVPGRPDRRGDP